MLARTSLLAVLLPLIVSSTSLANKHTAKQNKKQPQLIVKAHGFRNTKGVVRITLFNQAKGFPKDRKKAFRLLILTLKKKTLTFAFEKLPYGEYAVALWHDENNNNKMDRKWYGPPKEGLGVSRNAKSWFGPPPFKKAKIRFSKDKQSISIKMRYL
ncbi:MAG TPA: hypothetical protein DCE42_00110 [Myxococcales bacterium]|nr:hypothetical protein [Deltaproteobacteria bacterium]MBU50825.1 hypothetical protein [Deltaproteobacteria bacterium]HAA53124.1 hypothetical protein [Myxococcales bacterium]|tara:strand:+ start:2412 stop:2879 length:468 start_codon:yes stop_codon:yes gene_type:complete